MGIIRNRGGSESPFLGEFTSLAALQTAHPTAQAGNYAHVNPGDSPVQEYIWDTDDTQWVLGTAVTGVASVNGDAGPVVTLSTDDISDTSDANKYVTQNEKTAAASVQDLTANVIPVASTSGIVDSPVSVGAKMIESIMGIRAGSADGFEAGSKRLSSAGPTMQIRDMARNQSANILTSGMSKTGGSLPPMWPRYTGAFMLPSLSDKSENRVATVGQPWIETQFFNNAAGDVYSYIINNPTLTTFTDCNFQIWAGTSATGRPFFDYKTENNGVGFTFPPGDVSVIVPPLDDPDNGVEFQVGELYARIFAGDGQLIIMSGQTVTFPPAGEPNSRTQWIMYLEREVAFSEERKLLDDLDITATGSGKVITDMERAILERSAGLNNHKTINLSAGHTATTEDFSGADTVLFSFTNLNGQVDFIVPPSVIPDNTLWFVTNFSQGSSSNRVLLSVTPGLINGENDILLASESGIGISNTENGIGHIITEFMPGSSASSRVTGGSFGNNIITVEQSNASSVSIPLDLNDVDGSASGLPVNHTFSLSEQANTQQVIDFGTQSLQWTALNGGKLGLRFQLHTNQQGGFPPKMLSLKLDYGSASFTFPLSAYELDEDGLVELTIADDDYTAILNTDPTVTLTVNFRGYEFTGRFEFKELYNRETSLIHDDVERIADNSSGQVLHQLLPLIEGDEANIANLQAAVKALIQMIDDLPQSIPPAVLSWLINDVTITEATSTTLDPTRFNMFLANDQTQAVFVDPDQTVSGGDQLTGIIKDGLVRGQKMYELVMGTYADGDVMVHAFDGTNQTDLIKRTGDNIVAVKYIPAHGGGSRTVTEYPLPPNQFHHEWYRISLSTGAPNFEPVSSEVAFTQNVPTVSTTITILVRTVANGNVGETTTRTLAGVGGSADASDSFSLAVGPESIDVQTRWDASRQAIYVSGNPHVSGLAIVDLQVGVSYQVTETVPVTPETTQEIPIARYIAGTSIVMLFEPSLARVDSDASAMIIHTDAANVNTDYMFNTLFGTTDGGHLTVTSAAGQPSSWYDWNKFTPNQETITQISDRIMLPYLGWFVQNFNQETLANFDTQLTVRDADDDEIKAGQELILLDTGDGDRYNITIVNGVLTPIKL